jgi:hypothetical protein
MPRECPVFGVQYTDTATLSIKCRSIIGIFSSAEGILRLLAMGKSSFAAIC